jgi:hypothetical protein
MRGKNGIELPCQIPAEGAVFRALFPDYTDVAVEPRPAVEQLRLF